MASSYVSSTKTTTLLFAVLITTCMTVIPPVHSTEFEVGGNDGWKVPDSKSGREVYNQWASDNRFQVGDVVKFKYEKDSVMEVTESEYESCKSVHPIYYSNSGDTEIKLDRSGTFYFISGISGHCERGEKMIIKVMSPSDPPGTSPAPPSPDSSTAAVPPMIALAPLQALAALAAAVLF